MEPLGYWKECLAEAADECGVTLTDQQIAQLAESVQSAHENYSMAFYCPPHSDRASDIAREWEARLTQLQKEFDAYRDNAEIAVKKALRQHEDAFVTIGEHGEVFRYDGRTERIQ